MFFVLSKTVSFLIKPTTLIILAFIASLTLKKISLRRKFFALGFILLVVFTNEYISNTVIGWWEAEPKAIEELSHYQYAVVLGGMVDLEQEPRDRVYFNQSVDRIMHTIKLYKLHKVEKILVTGGSGSIYDQSVKEGIVLHRFMLENGVDEDDIIIESESRNTYENAVFTKELIDPTQAGKILLITSASHMRRGAACFMAAGFDFDTFPTSFRHDKFKPHMLYTPSADSLNKWDVLFKEMFGYLVYALVGYL